jgi:protein-tyrosine phosphatase
MIGRRASVNEILAGRIYQRGQFLTWPYEQKKQLLDEFKIDIVVNMWSKVDPDMSTGDQGRVYLCWLTSPSEVPEHADLFVRFLMTLVRQGKRILIHCEAGRGRSVWLSTRLLAEVEEISRAEALSRVEAIMHHSLTPSLKRDLV